MVDFFEDSSHLFTWKPREAGLRDLGGVELNNADVASYPGWALLEWDEEELFDCESRNDDFIFRTEKGGRLQHLPRLLPNGRIAVKLDTSSLFEMIRKSAEPGVRLVGAILLFDPEALRSLCDETGDSAVCAKAANGWLCMRHGAIFRRMRVRYPSFRRKRSTAVTSICIAETSFRRHRPRSMP